MIKIGEERYMTPEQYAIHCGVTVQTVYNWIKKKEIITRKLMDKTLIRI